MGSCEAHTLVSPVRLQHSHKHMTLPYRYELEQSNMSINDELHGLEWKDSNIQAIQSTKQSNIYT